MQKQVYGIITVAIFKMRHAYNIYEVSLPAIHKSQRFTPPLT